MESSFQRVSSIFNICNSSNNSLVPEMKQKKKCEMINIGSSRRVKIQEMIKMKYDPSKTHIQKQDVKKIIGKARLESKEYGRHTFYLIKWKGKPNQASTWEHPRLFTNINSKIVPFNINIKQESLPYIDPKYIKTCPNSMEILKEFLQSFIEMKRKQNQEKMGLHRIKSNLLQSDEETYFGFSQKANRRVAKSTTQAFQKKSQADIGTRKTKKNKLLEKKHEKKITTQTIKNMNKGNEKIYEVIRSPSRSYDIKIGSQKSDCQRRKYENFTTSEHQNLSSFSGKSQKFNSAANSIDSNFHFKSLEKKEFFRDSPKQRSERSFNELIGNKKLMNSQPNQQQFWQNEEQIQPGEIKVTQSSFYSLQYDKLEKNQLEETESFTLDSIQSEEHSQKRKANGLFVSKRHLDTELKDYFLKNKFTRNADIAKFD